MRIENIKEWKEAMNKSLERIMVRKRSHISGGGFGGCLFRF